ncbi:MAG: sortase [Ilumatobacteraceae bacterium]
MRNRLTPILLVASAITAGGVITACGSSGDAESTTVAPATEAPTTTEAATTTSTSVYAGPPTLGPGETLPTPVPPPKEDGTKDDQSILGSIEIPALKVKETIYQGIRLSTFDLGVGHWPGTALPGKVGNVVLGGHRTSGIRPFRNVDQLKKGDEIIVTTDDGTFVYVVDGQQIVDPVDGMWIIEQTEKASMTLFACHPPGSVRQRIIIFANYDRKLEV